MRLFAFTPLNPGEESLPEEDTEYLERLRALGYLGEQDW